MRAATWRTGRRAGTWKRRVRRRAYLRSSSVCQQRWRCLIETPLSSGCLMRRAAAGAGLLVLALPLPLPLPWPLPSLPHHLYLQAHLPSMVCCPQWEAAALYAAAGWVWWPARPLHLRKQMPARACSHLKWRSPWGRFQGGRQQQQAAAASPPQFCRMACQSTRSSSWLSRSRGFRKQRWAGAPAGRNWQRPCVKSLQSSRQGRWA
mmetsp:Transcript_37767/g.84210  ORF Transcript_37767/g.84210 Transcript_37767/m.84210 type:complete len:206 (+) Transcript_37767:1758-2375(+)